MSGGDIKSVGVNLFDRLIEEIKTQEENLNQKKLSSSINKKSKISQKSKSKSKKMSLGKK